MLSTWPELLTGWLASLPPAYVMGLELLVAFGGLLLLIRLFGEAGGFVFMPLAVIAANTQVLKAVQFPFYQDPVALGTILFSATYLATDILTELYGKASARKAVWIGFVSYLLFVVYMLITIGYAPLTPEQAGEGMAWNLPYQDHMKALFLPAPAFFLASMCSYLISQFHDVWLYDWIRGKTGNKMLWLRNNVATMISAFIDNLVFSVLAWKVFAPAPIDNHSLIYTYILGTYLLRVVIALLDTPFLYLARATLKPKLPVAAPAPLPA